MSDVGDVGDVGGAEVDRLSFVALWRSTQGDECDPGSAPGGFHGPHSAPPFTWRRARQNLVWVYVVGLVFLTFAAIDIDPGAGPAALVVVQVVFLVVLALSYVGTAWACDLPYGWRWVYLGWFVGLLVLGGTWGWGITYQGVYVAVMVATLIPWRTARVAIPVWSLVVAATYLIDGEVGALLMGVVTLGVGLATGGSIEAGRVRGELDRAQQRVSTLSVAAERERIGRDLHDILGHSLTAISIKAGLAARLVDSDPAAARAQIAEVEDVARQALADVRATASAMHEVRLATELASARSVLLAAGVEAVVPSALPPLDRETNELFGFVVREAVTNVVRHSEAHVCTVAVGFEQVSVSDDGVGIGSQPGGGSGLRGLAERVGSAGGELTWAPRPGGGTVVRATMPRPPGSLTVPATARA